jgi:hypothetical protein
MDAAKSAIMDAAFSLLSEFYLPKDRLEGLVR